MPTYEYRCKSCSTELEVVQSFTDDPLTTCEACGGELRKVFAAPGISFKGSGFYKTDSRSGSSSSSSDAGGEKKDGDKKDKDSKDPKPSSEKKDAKAGTSDTSSSGSGDKATKAPAAASSTS